MLRPDESDLKPGDDPSLSMGFLGRVPLPEIDSTVDKGTAISQFIFDTNIVHFVRSL